MPRLVIAVVLPLVLLTPPGIAAARAPAADLATNIGRLSALDYPTRMNAARAIRRHPDRSRTALVQAVQTHKDEFVGVPRLRPAVVLQRSRHGRARSRAASRCQRPAARGCLQVAGSASGSGDGADPAPARFRPRKRNSSVRPWCRRWRRSAMTCASSAHFSVKSDAGSTSSAAPSSMRSAAAGRPTRSMGSPLWRKLQGPLQDDAVMRSAASEAARARQLKPLAAEPPSRRSR